MLVGCLAEKARFSGLALWAGCQRLPSGAGLGHLAEEVAHPIGAAGGDGQAGAAGLRVDVAAPGQGHLEKFMATAVSGRDRPRDPEVAQAGGEVGEDIVRPDDDGLPVQSVPCGSPRRQTPGRRRRRGTPVSHETP